MTAREIVAALAGRWHGSYGTARCPAHEDKNPSLSVSERDGKVLVKCHGPCEQEDVIDALRGLGLWGGGDDHTSPVIIRKLPIASPRGGLVLALLMRRM